MTLKRRAFERAHKIANPCPFEKRIFLCRKCRAHKYMPELAEDNTCHECHRKADSTPPVDAVAGIGQDSAGSTDSAGCTRQDNADEQSRRDENTISQDHQPDPGTGEREVNEIL